ncbi:serine protease HTRA3 isoform 1 precursor, partial [Daubentonia madagascariensis]
CRRGRCSWPRWPPWRWPGSPRRRRAPRAATCRGVRAPRCPGGYVPDLCNCCLVCAASEGETCGRPLDSPCGESLECARGVCRCRWAHAVCGTDGHTYANVCALQAASRRALQLSGTPVRQLQKGACPSDWKKRFIGIRMRTITPSLVDELKASNPDFPAVSSGIYVQEVVPDSPSQRGGIQDGDIIVKVNGRRLADSSELQEAVLTESPLLLEVRRGNDDLLFSIAPEVVV